MAVLTFSTDASPDASSDAGHHQIQPNKKVGSPALNNNKDENTYDAVDARKPDGIAGITPPPKQNNQTRWGR